MRLKTGSIHNSYIVKFVLYNYVNRSLSLKNTGLPSICPLPPHRCNCIIYVLCINTVKYVVDTEFHCTDNNTVLISTSSINVLNSIIEKYASTHYSRC